MGMHRLTAMLMAKEIKKIPSDDSSLYLFSCPSASSVAGI